jgi:hypothetical protein
MNGAPTSPAVLSIIPRRRIRSSIRNSPQELRQSPQALVRGAHRYELQSAEAIRL